MKLTIAFLILLVIGIYAVPVMAYDTPSQGTDNATDVINWHGDTANISITSGNLTLATDNITINDMDEAMEAGAQVLADKIDDILVLFIYVVVSFGLAAVSLSKNDKPLLFISGLLFLLFAFVAYSDYGIALIFSFLMGIAGVFLMARAFTHKGVA